MGESKRRKEIDPNYGKAPSDIKLKIKPDYTRLVEIFLNQESSALIEEIFAWLGKTGQIHEGEKVPSILNCVNQITRTVYELASKESKKHLRI